MLTDKPVIGSVDEQGFSWHKPIRYQNSFQTYLSGAFFSRGGETHIDCTSGMNRSTRIFLVAWPVAIGFLTLPALFEGNPVKVNGHETQGSMALLIFIGLFMSFAFVVAAIGRLIARHEHAYLLNLLTSTVEAAPAQPQTTAQIFAPARREPTIQR